VNQLTTTLPEPEPDSKGPDEKTLCRYCNTNPALGDGVNTLSLCQECHEKLTVFASMWWDVSSCKRCGRLHREPLAKVKKPEALCLCPECLEWTLVEQNKVLSKQHEVISALTNKIEILQAAISELKPKAAVFDRISQTQKSYSIAQVAEILQVRRNTLIHWLEHNNWIDQYNSQSYCQPNQGRINQGFLTIETVIDRGNTELQIFLTHKGLSVIAILLGKELSNE